MSATEISTDAPGAMAVAATMAPLVPDEETERVRRRSELTLLQVNAMLDPSTMKCSDPEDEFA